MSGAQTRNRYFKNFLIFSIFCLYIAILATLRVETTEWILMNVSPILYHSKRVLTFIVKFSMVLSRAGK